MGRLRVRLAAAAIAALLLVVAFPTAPAHHQGHRHWSTIPDGPYGVLPATPQTFLASDGTHISYAVFMPDVPPGTRVPVILSAGPYFGLLEEPVHLPSSSRLTGFLVDNYVSHGYAVVAASVRGTGLSGGCMELMSAREALDLHELVTFLGEQPWSNGAVAMTGKSYDGSTPWMVAQFGNPYLKTIVPLQGVTDLGDLLVHHGVPQFRTPLFHPYVYYPYGFGDPRSPTTGRALEDRAANLACPEAAEGTAAGVWATYTGDITATPGLSAYWKERAWREPTLANYEGSVFIVHSLQDFNVVPHMVAPFFNDLPQTKKMLLGQWGHHYPDEAVRMQHAAPTLRMDFAAILKTWLDRELKGLDVDTGPVVEVADARTGAWRQLDAWPLAPTEVKEWHLSVGRKLTEGAPAPFRVLVASPAGAMLGPSCLQRNAATFASEPLGAATRFSGVGAVTVRLDPATHANVVAELCLSDGTVVAHGATNTLYADATNTPKPFAPGLPLDVRVEFEPVEFTIPAGAELLLSIHVEDFVSGRAGGGYWPGTSPGVIAVTGGTLEIPVA